MARSATSTRPRDMPRLVFELNVGNGWSERSGPSNKTCKTSRRSGASPRVSGPPVGSPRYNSGAPSRGRANPLLHGKMLAKAAASRGTARPQAPQTSRHHQDQRHGSQSNVHKFNPASLNSPPFDSSKQCLAPSDSQISVISSSICSTPAPEPQREPSTSEFAFSPAFSPCCSTPGKLRRKIVDEDGLNGQVEALNKSVEDLVKLGRRSLSNYGAAASPRGASMSPRGAGMSPRKLKQGLGITKSPGRHHEAPATARPGSQFASEDAKTARLCDASKIARPQPASCGVLVLDPEAVQREFHSLNHRMDQMLSEQREIRRSQLEIEQLLRESLSSGHTRA